jgi:hypothetical protein
LTIVTQSKTNVKIAEHRKHSNFGQNNTRDFTSEIRSNP